MQERLNQETQDLVASTKEKVEEIQKRRTKPSEFLDEDINPTKLHILAGLQNSNVYAGTVPPEIVRRRRMKNKAARKARRANRSK